MFSLESGIDGQREPVQLPLVDPLDPHAVLHRATYLPTFGAGHDLYVAANASTSNSSMSNLRTYAMPDGGGGADANNTYLTGSQSFRPDAVEVLQVRLKCISLALSLSRALLLSLSLSFMNVHQPLCFQVLRTSDARSTSNSRQLAVELAVNRVASERRRGGGGLGAAAELADAGDNPHGRTLHAKRDAVVSFHKFMQGSDEEAARLDREEQRLVEQQRAFEEEQRFMEMMLPLPINAANIDGPGTCSVVYHRFVNSITGYAIRLS